MSRYGQLADQLQQQITSGLWQPGERISSIRQSCKTHGLSPMTVLQAYQLLESRGLILALAMRIQRAERLEPSATSMVTSRR